ncbi:YbfB/YjiJ family MFS transporter [Paracraurococcus sp. LOR1-02]|uniref:YbfB/YjiJ family MFS transporter n=1 Tax=Paracraurococcus lichenis TaxID=3064888 RepID=A0ABT9E9T1_9PROT|nr:YbfB/YjiJ family MFS transporter [Paracraurococcus sp. LOR1-02]MDO9712924.1 YbfB/YjiJ family MFS transporter [Paracraurococcus sp. LOR1-02]
MAAGPSVAAWTRLGARTGIARAFAAACLVEAAGVAASVLWPTATGALVAAALLGGTFMGITALGLAGGRGLAGGDPRRAFALLTASFGLGQIAGPVLAGVLHDLTGSFVLASLLPAGALVVAAAVAAGVPMTAETLEARHAIGRRGGGIRC